MPDIEVRTPNYLRELGISLQGSPSLASSAGVRARLLRVLLCSGIREHASDIGGKWGNSRKEARTADGVKHQFNCYRQTVGLAEGREYRRCRPIVRVSGADKGRSDGSYSKVARQVRHPERSTRGVSTRAKGNRWHEVVTYGSNVNIRPLVHCYEFLFYRYPR